MLAYDYPILGIFWTMLILFLWIGWLFIVIASAFEFIILLGSKNHMRLGDVIAKTTVIEIPQAKQEA